MLKNIQKRYNDVIVKYNVQEKMRKIITSENVKIFAVLFVMTRLYKIYHGVCFLLKLDGGRDYFERNFKLSVRGTVQSYYEC
jgi:hypothetical protein